MVEIRGETPSDRAAALRVEARAFDDPEEAAIVKAVRDEEGSFAFVAVEEGTVVGHVQMSHARVGETTVLALGPVGVLPERQGQGIGSALIWAALSEARVRSYPAVILLGSPNFYPRFGFESASSFGLQNPFAGVLPNGFVVKEEDFMVAPLDERARSLAGEVVWHSAFGQRP
jgi:putative acetyltransferase